MKRQLWLVAYDTPSGRRRRRFLRRIRRHAPDGQKSVYECWLTRAERKSLLADLKTLATAQSDRWFLLRLDTRARMIRSGRFVQPGLPDLIRVA